MNGNRLPALTVVARSSFGDGARGQGDVPWTCLTDPEGNEFRVLAPS